MKNITKTFFIAASVAFIIASCGDAKIKVEHYENNVQEALCENSVDSITISTSIEFAKEAENINSNIVNYIFGEDYDGLSVTEASDNFIQNTIANYKEECMDFRKDWIEYEKEEAKKEGNEEINEEELAKTAIPGANWNYDIKSFFTPAYNNIASYLISYYTYTGGAHGSTQLTALNFNLKTGEIITEKDFFKEGSEEELAKLLSKNLKNSFEDEEAYESLFVKDIEPNGNFYISKDGVTYIYNEYEIGAYYLGRIQVVIPWNEVKHLVQE